MSDIERMKQVREMYSQCHDLLIVGMFPGGAFKALPGCIDFMMSNVKDLDEKIKTMEESNHTGKKENG